jgi:hypothetical protein
MRLRRFLCMAGAVPILAMASITAQAVETNTGGGALEGSVNFTSGGVPMASTACIPDSWTFSASTAAVVFDIANDEFVGTLSLYGGGTSACAVGGAETGSLNITATNSQGLGHFNCTVGGGYARVLSHVHADLQGTCTVNNHTDPAEFIAEGEFVPTATSGPLTNPVVSAASFAGSFVVAPPF